MNKLKQTIKKIDTQVEKIPSFLSSKPIIYFYIFLLFYLVVVALIIPTLVPISIQIPLGNFTNVASALGAGLAAGSALKSHLAIKDMDNKHAELANKHHTEHLAEFKRIHAKLDKR
jgi:hypothetical protein